MICPMDDFDFETERQFVFRSFSINTVAAMPATLQKVDGVRTLIRLDTPQFGFANGQTATLNDTENESVVLGDLDQFNTGGQACLKDDCSPAGLL